MSWMTRANDNWKQAQAILIDVQIDIWFAVNEIGSHDSDYWYYTAIRKLVQSLHNGHIVNGDYQSNTNLNWVDILIEGLRDAVAYEYDPPPADALLLPNASRQEQRNHDLGHLYSFQRQALYVQEHALSHFEAIAKRAYHDRMFAQMQADDKLTKGSPLGRDISEQEEHLGNLYP